MTALDFYKERLKERGFSDKQIKDLTDHKDLPWLQFAEDYHKKQLMLGGVSVPKETLRFHLEALTKEIEDIHNYGFDDVLSNYLKRNAL